MSRKHLKKSKPKLQPKKPKPIKKAKRARKTRKQRRRKKAKVKRARAKAVTRKRLAGSPKSQNFSMIWTKTLTNTTKSGVSATNVITSNRDTMKTLFARKRPESLRRRYEVRWIILCERSWNS